MLHSPSSLETRCPMYARIGGPIVMIGFGSIGSGALPLIERHFEYDPDRFYVIDPGSRNKDILEKHGIRHLDVGLNQANYREILLPLLRNGEGQGFCINLSVDVSSLAILRLCREIECLYLDTSLESWAGFLQDKSTDPALRTNYALREELLRERQDNPGGVTAISGCGANPGLVSWLVKEGLVNLCRDIGIPSAEPHTRAEWAQLMQRSGVTGIHIAERDTQKTFYAKPQEIFFNTWSVEGIIAEGLQSAELGWGTRERWIPLNARTHPQGCKASIFLTQPGANTWVHSWCPTSGPQYGLLISHNEAISIADYFTVGSGALPDYRPTVNYAYHPCSHALLSIFEMLGCGAAQEYHHLMAETEITGGHDELGVLFYGHAKNAYWYGSQLTIEETRKLAPYQNSTGLQVTSGVLAGMVWALENPEAGIVEADDMDFRRCLAVQKPYLGTVKGFYTDWTPLSSPTRYFPQDVDESDPWQFKNILVRQAVSQGLHLPDDWAAGLTRA